MLTNLLMLANTLPASGHTQGKAAANSNAVLVKRLAHSFLVHYLFTTVAKDNLALKQKNAEYNY